MRASSGPAANSSQYRHEAQLRRRADAPRAEARVAEHRLQPGRLAQLRAFVRLQARSFGLVADRADDLVLAVNEVAGNSLLYAGGGADVRLWRARSGVVCEVRDSGVITDPMIGRVAPGLDEHDSRGLWIVNQVCDLVRVRSSADGTLIRMHVGV